MVELMPPNNINWRALGANVLLSLGLLGLSTPVAAQSNIRATLHNLSVTGPGIVKSANETEVCVFCHTPHNANTTISAGDTTLVKRPLWNRATNVETYTRYSSSSLDANVIADGFSSQPGGSSLLCLSCHDGTVAIGNVNINPRNPGASISMTGVDSGGVIPAGAYGANSGYARIGTNLTNDHPISISYTKDLSDRDKELTPVSQDQQRDLASSGDLIGVRSRGYKPLLPLEPTGPNNKGQVQCATCHDPHLNKEKFLRLNRLQTNNAPDGTGVFKKDNDQICLACHPKLGAAWAESAHAREDVANETYTTGAAALRGFTGTPAVWRVACLNCHDTHTVQGSRRLLREGVGSATSALGANDKIYQPGASPAPAADLNKSSAIENTCFQCHRNVGVAAGNILDAKADSIVPSIKSLFDLPYGMPVRSDDQADPNNLERHDVVDSDLTESPENLGLKTASATNKDARHAECPDCHNPHRLRRNSKFYGSSTNSMGNSNLRTHDPSVGGLEGNVASGVLRGGWGVEPTFSAISTNVWPRPTGTYRVVKGDPGIDTSTATSKPYLTREYQLCFKCHSDYSNGPLTTDFQSVGYASLIRSSSRRGTPQTLSNGMKLYTNVAAEFGSVNAGVNTGSVNATGSAVSGTDQGEKTNLGSACDGSDCIPSGSNDGTASYGGTNVNHRSWHPVMFPTGRDRAERGMSSSATEINVLPPFKANIGKQTMQCSDCHGQSSSYTPGVGPIAAQPQGPHGSDQPFLLRGKWDTTVRLGSLTGSLCRNCHNPGGNSVSSGFLGNHVGGGAKDEMVIAPCMFCHIAVPHGWKNKAFLVNMKCVGLEGGQVGNCVEVRGSNPTVAGTSSTYSASYLPPYYNAAKTRIGTWQRSGAWTESSCSGDMTNCGTGL